MKGRVDVSHGTIIVGAQQYRAVVLVVESVEDGIPRHLTLIDPDKETNQHRGKQFVTAYIPQHLMDTEGQS